MLTLARGDVEHLLDDRGQNQPRALDNCRGVDPLATVHPPHQDRRSFVLRQAYFTAFRRLRRVDRQRREPEEARRIPFRRQGTETPTFDDAEIGQVVHDYARNMQQSALPLVVASTVPVRAAAATAADTLWDPAAVWAPVGFMIVSAASCPRCPRACPSS